MTKKISPELNRKAQQVPGPAKENRSTHMHLTGQFEKGEKVPSPRHKEKAGRSWRIRGLNGSQFPNSGAEQ